MVFVEKKWIRRSCSQAGRSYYAISHQPKTFSENQIFKSLQETVYHLTLDTNQVCSCYCMQQPYLDSIALADTKGLTPCACA